MYNSNYKLDEKINTSIDWVLYFLKSYYWRDISYSSEIFDSKVIEYSFNWSHRINWFYDILALNYIWAIDLKILDYNARDNWNLSTNIDLSEVDKASLDCSLEDYLYKNFDEYIDNIEQHSSMQISIFFIPSIFLEKFMKIIFQELKISKLPNYKILNNLIDRIKSEAKWKPYKLWKIPLFYELYDYLDYESSIYPMLYELQERNILIIKEIELRDWYIIFKIEKIINIDSINKEEIINLFWSSDKNISTWKINDVLIDENILKIENKEVDWIKIDYINWLIKNISWEIILKLTQSEKFIIVELKKKIKEWWMSKDNLKEMTRKPTLVALNQTIKELKRKIKATKIEEFIFIEYKKWEKIYNLCWKYFEKW